MEDDYRKAAPGSLVFREAQLIERTIRDNFAEEVDKIVVDDPILAETLSSRMRGVEVEYYSGQRNIFRNFGLSEQIDKLAERKVTIEGGAYLVIDRTEALTVIDVNTGRFVGGKDLEDTVFRTNIAAADEVARQLRMRNISGIVIVDFIDMQSDEHRKAVVERLREDLKRDRLKTSAVSMTGLGLVELTRKRTRLSRGHAHARPLRELRGRFRDFGGAHRVEAQGGAGGVLARGCGQGHHREGASMRGGAGVPLRHHGRGRRRNCGRAGGSISSPTRLSRGTGSPSRAATPRCSRCPPTRGWCNERLAQHAAVCYHQMCRTPAARQR